MDDVSVVMSGICVGASKDNVFFLTGKTILKYNSDCSEILSSAHLDFDFVDTNYKYLRLPFRVLRLGVISGVCGQKTLFLWTRRNYYIIEMNSLRLVRKGIFGDISPPINVIALPSNDSGMEDIFLFGEYKSNPQKDSVSICTVSANSLDKLLSIPAGRVNHVHNIVYAESGAYFVFCGDWGSGAAIWKLDYSAKTIHELVSGKQLFRGSCGIVKNGRLIYATDTTSIPNKMVSIDGNNGTYFEAQDLPASAIYSACFNDALVFSTNMEVSLATKHRWNKWITRELPSVFYTNKVHVYRWADDQLFSIFEAEPSWLPYRLFQYPTFRVHVNELVVILSGYSLRKFDNTSVLLKNKY